MRQEALVLRFLPRLVIFAALLGAAQIVGANPERPTLLADTEGKISAVALSINSARRAALRNAPAVGNLVNALPAGTAISIFANDLSAFTVVDNREGAAVQFVELPADNPITIWPQDPFLVLQGPAGDQPTTLLMSKTFERAGDANMARHLGESRGYQLRQSSLHFEGGNIVSDEEHVLIGANTIRFNALERNVGDNEVGLAFQSELGKPVLVVGPFPQPVAHIDMMLTPLGDGRMAVADASMGLAVVEKALAENPVSVTRFERYCEEQFFGHPSITGVRGKEGELITAPDLAGRTADLIEMNRAIAPILDGIAAGLASAGYEIVRIPFYFGGPESRPASQSGEDDSVATYPMLTYNNTLIERRDDALRVYLPRYGWPAMDEAAENAWRDAGFVTQSVAGLTISAMYGGALRCSVKVLEREQSRAPAE